MSFPMSLKDASGTSSPERTWRQEQKEIWDPKCGHIYMGAGGFTQKHGVGILLNKRWKTKDHQNGICQRKKAYHHYQSHQRRIECSLHPLKLFGRSHRNNVQIKNCNKKHTTIIAGDFNAHLGLGDDPEHVGKHAKEERNKSGFWMKQWLMIQNCVAINKTFKNVPEKQAAFRICEWER